MVLVELTSGTLLGQAKIDELQARPHKRFIAGRLSPLKRG